MNEPEIKPLRAIGMKILNVLFITLLLSVVKKIQGLPVWELMFFRSILAGIILVPFLAAQGSLRSSMKTNRHGGLILRSVLALITMGLTFVAVRHLPLPEAVTLQYTQPLFVVALSAILLKVPVGLFRWGAVCVGFVGVLIITLPKLTLLRSGVSALSYDETIGVSAALGAAFCFSLSILWTAQLVRTEKSTTITMWLAIYGSLLLLLTLPLGWQMPSLSQFGMLVLAGALGAGTQLALNESLRAAPATTSAPFEYSSVIFAAILGYVVFGDVPDLNTVSGASLLILAGLAIIWRERHLKRQKTLASRAEMPPG